MTMTDLHCLCPSPLCATHGDPRLTSFDRSRFLDMPTDTLTPPAAIDPDVITLRFTVHLNREGWLQYIATWPYFRGETPFETLAREAIAAWDTEGLLALSDGEPEVKRLG